MALISFKTETVWYYNNILLIISASALFLFFKEINLKEIKAIGFISKCSLGVFLLHTTNIFVTHYNGLFDIEGNVTAGLGTAILNLLLVVFSTIAICVAIDILLRLAVTPLKKKIYSLKFLNYNIIDLSQN